MALRPPPRTLLKHGYAKTLAAQPVGSLAQLVSVEADLTRGLHSFSVVGLPDKAVAEARDRVSAINRFKDSRALATRYEKRGHQFLATIQDRKSVV